MKNVHFQCIRKKSALKTTKRPQAVFYHVLPATKPSELRRHLAITTVLIGRLQRRDPVEEFDVSLLKQPIRNRWLI